MTLRYLPKSTASSLLCVAALFTVVPAWAQSTLKQRDKSVQLTPPTAADPDRATAYYHEGLAHLYEELAINNGRPDYATQAVEEYKLALNADPDSKYLQDGLAAVTDLDLEIIEHSIHSIIGPNGAGKTTAFNLITQNLSPTTGQVIFRGERIDGLTPDRVAKAGISRTYQNIRLFRNITAIENLLVGMHLHLKSHWWGAVFSTPHTRRDEAEAAETARGLLNFVGLRGRGDFLARNLAYGEQRRLEIGRALATKPKLLLLDEPTAGMNPTETSDMMTFIQQVRETYGITIVLIEHQMRVVMSMSDRVTVLDHGTKIAEGRPAEVQENPAVIEAYLGTQTKPSTARDHAAARLTEGAA